MNFLELIKEFGLIAGIAGISVGVLLYLFRNIISIKILSILTKKQAFAVIITFMILVFTVSIYSIYQYGEINKISNDEGKSKPKTEVENSEITEEINETVPEEAENLYLINKEGVGRFKLGNNLSQVTLPDNWSINKINKLYPAEGNLLKKPEFIVKNQDGDDWLHIKTTNILYSKTNNHEYDTNTLNEYISSDTISEIELIDPRIKTSRGLNSNSSIIDVKRLYPFSEPAKSTL